MNKNAGKFETVCEREENERILSFHFRNLRRKSKSDENERNFRENFDVK